MDQYLDKPYQMNAEDTNKGGYKASDLRETLRSKEILDIFDDWSDRMIPFDNGDLLRIPFAGELFGDKLPKWYEPDGHEQWPLMRVMRNRIASRRDEYDWGWLQNKNNETSTHFCAVASSGLIAAGANSNVLGVRPAFLIATYKEEAETCHS